MRTPPEFPINLFLSVATAIALNAVLKKLTVIRFSRSTTSLKFHPIHNRLNDYRAGFTLNKIKTA